MYRWNDPIEPEGARRRPEQPTDEGPAWLTDRPEPRSSYLFGDGEQQPPPGYGPTGRGAEPAGSYPPPRNRWNGEEQPAAWHGQEQPADAWHGQGSARTGHEQPTAAWHGQEPTWHGREPGWTGNEQPAGGWEQPTATWQPASDIPADEPRRRKRRLSRPLVIGGAAAAATLVVSLGVAAVLLPGDDQGTRRTSADAPVAAAPQAPEDAGDTPADTLAAESASPSAVPTTAAPSPSKKAAPKPSRSTAPSRQQERSSAPSGGGTGATKATATTQLSAELQKVVTLVNQERAKAGCKALTVNAKLNLAAQRHSQDQADHKKMDHTGSNGSQPWDRVKAAGYSYSMVGENVAWGYQTAAEVMDGWMNSEGHRKNILNCGYTQIGMGLARSNGPYWTQVFGTPR